MSYEQYKAPAGVSLLNNYTATSAPTANDDSGDGYSVGSVWIDTTADERYVCLDNTLTSAVWAKTTAGTATEIVFTPAGSLASTNVQDALEELDGDLAGAGGALKYIDSFNFETYTTGNKAENNHSGGGSVSFPGQGGLGFNVPGASAGGAGILWDALGGGGSVSTLDYDDGLEIRLRFVGSAIPASHEGKFFFCTGIVTPADDTMATTTKHIGFFIDIGAGAVAGVYASNANGSAQTLTDVTGSFPSWTQVNWLRIVLSATDVKFYINKTLVATHTTNLPTGAFTGFYVHLGVKNNSGETTAWSNAIIASRMDFIQDVE